MVATKFLQFPLPFRMGNPNVNRNATNTNKMCTIFLTKKHTQKKGGKGGGKCGSRNTGKIMEMGHERNILRLNMSLYDIDQILIICEVL